MGAPPRRPLIAGNWKMNLNHLEAIAHVQKLAYSLRREDTERAEVVVLPPFTDLRSVQTLIDGDRLAIGYGAQDLSEHASGAHTGDVSGSMLARLGCRYVVVGHSERRAEHGETDEVVAAKVRAAFAVEVAPLLCVGEGEDIRDAGRHVAHTTEQLRAALGGLPAGQLSAVVLAYEPIWAIGTGRVARPEDAQEVCAALRKALTELAGGDAAGREVAGGVRILYGGSVKGDNIDALMSQPDIDGALVGGASLDLEEFVRIIRFRAPGP
jgi:triosephosphate isomerase